MKRKIYSAFTLAEMMVVMLILSIIMAAFAPVMTTRSKTERNSPWRYASNNFDIYYGLGLNSTALIGQPEKKQGIDPSTRLIINTSSDTQKHITFKRGENNVVGSIHMSGPSSILIGSSDSPVASQAIAIGNKVTVTTSPGIAIGEGAESKNNLATALGFYSKALNTVSTSLGSYSSAEETSSTAVGYKALASGKGSSAFGANANTSGEYSTALGYEATASGDNSTAIGEYASAEASQAIALHSRATGKSSTAIGYGTASNEFSLLLAPGKSTGGGENKSESIGYASTAIGSNSHARGGYSVAIGTGSTTNSDRTLSIGPGAYTTGSAALAMGSGASAKGENSVSIGYNSKATNTDAVALGSNVTASGESSIAIGSHEPTDNTTASGDGSVAIGDGAVASGKYAVALGSSAKAKGIFNTAIGQGACLYVTGSNKTCIGANSGPADATQRSDTSTESIYFGSAGTFKRRDDRYNSGVNSIMELHKRGDYALAVVNADLVVRGDLISMPRKKSGGRSARYGSFRTKYIDNQIEFDNIGDPSEGFFSDRRLKYVGQEFTTGLDKIKQLRVFNYTFKDDEKKTPHVGVIAQDLQKVFPNAVTKNEDGFLTIRFEDMFYAIVNAVKELDAKVTLLIKKDSDKDAKIKALEAKNAELEARLKRLEAKIK